MNPHHSPYYFVQEEDWSLHHKGKADKERHDNKVKKAIKENLPHILTDDSLILSDGKEIIKIPIRSLEEYKIRFDFERKKHVGQGEGEVSPGDIIATDKQSGAGKGKGAGSERGVDYYEVEVTLEEIEEALFADLELPYLEEKEQDIVTTHIEFNDIRKSGLMGNVDKKKTILAALKRNLLHGEKSIHPILQEDLRFKTWNEEEKEKSNAVIIAMMDTSGSMGNYEKYVARSFFFWMHRFLQTKYDHVEIIFIAHHTEASIVTKEEFFSKGESGGTICSSAYQKALELIEKKYSPERYNIYPFHLSDGDNLSSDNDRCVQLLSKILEKANMFGYSEVNQYYRQSSLMNAFKNIKHERFYHYIIKQKQDIYEALKTFFKKRTK